MSLSLMLESGVNMEVSSKGMAYCVTNNNTNLPNLTDNIKMLYYEFLEIQST